MDILEVCQMVARSLVSEIGPWGDKCVLFGGLVPGILVPNPSDPLAPHIGTKDVDLAIRVAAIGEDREMYRTLKANLKSLGLVQSSNPSFEWRREVDGIEVVVELFVPVDDPAQAGEIQRKPIDKGGSGLSALGVYGLDLIDRDLEEIEDEGPLLDERGIKKVTLRICGPAMLVALKAWALKERNKPKDGYDTVWILKAYGPEEIAKRFLAADLHQTPFGQSALVALAENFKSHEHTGSIGWVSESQFEGEERTREAREGSGVVKDFLQFVEAGSKSSISQ